MEKLDAKMADKFYSAILSLETKEECRAFFDDICTIKEMQDLIQRLEVASMLTKGMNYQEISSKTSVSSATICRVNRCINYGEGGYTTVLGRIEKYD